ncbi:MAG TPA: TonB-dependent receptor [Vitreimonas sp.]|uniref:TonB-dependent receptor n=1 Tax=Vitreimonas sp. TaxID=3069702 RepID=UPI002D5FFDC1|nr:TonB-dependent receptor [Vitreimonas sp.]HYD88784.1 TonB-dependent receptor [Vitreimonas sp.]
MKLVLGVGGALAFAPSAFAQGAVDAVEEEIVVTATKRGEALAQDVPLAVTAYSAEQLQALNFQDLQSLTYTMPNVQLEDVGTARGVANFSIRGIGINSSIPSVDPAVGVFVDGVYMGINSGILADNFDLEAVEVLRGPQGTLYGRNVTGGAVLVRTALPSDEFEVTGRVAVETGLQYIGDFSVSGPIVEDVLTAKFATYYTRDEGWFENDYDGSQFGEGEMQIYRGALRFTPTRDFEAILRLEQGFSDGDGPAAQNHSLFARDSFDFAINEPGFSSGDWEQAILETNWDVGFGDGTITNIAGWRSYNSLTGGDIDSTPNTAFHSRSVVEQEQFSNELRYAGTFGPVEVTSGLYYFDQSLLYIEERLLFSGVILPSPPFPAGTPLNLTRVGGGYGEFSTFGAFANADWHLNEQLTLNLGLRYTHEEKDAWISRIRSGPIPGIFPGDNLDGAAVVPGEGVTGGSIDGRSLVYSDTPFQLSWNDTSPRIGIQWEPTPDTNLYAFWAQGFRSGGVNFRVTTLTPVGGGSGAPTAFDAEEQSSFEIGLKQDFLDGRGRVNVAVFHNTIDDMQRETNVPDVGSGVQQVIVNAGEAVIQGAELEARYRVTDAFMVSAQVGYTEGEYDTVTADLNGDGAITAADANLDIPRLAPWTYGVNFIYDLDLFSGVLSSRLGYNHRDAAFYNDANTGKLAEADIVDLNFTFTPGEGDWSFAVYGNNLTNDVTWGGDTVLPNLPWFGGVGAPTNTFSPLNEGRVIGAEFRFRY